jgi:hypothetical protein
MIRLPVKQRTNLVRYVNTYCNSPPQAQVNIIYFGISDYSITHRSGYSVLKKGYSSISYVENAPTQASSVLFLAYLICIITNLIFGIRNTILYLSLRSYMSEAITLGNLYSLLRRGIYQRYKMLRYTHHPSRP